MQGTRGAFSQQALLGLLPQALPHFCGLPEETFLAVEEGEADAILLPLRNALAGAVMPHYEVLRRNLLGPPGGRVRCVAECDLPVHLHLIGLGGAQLPEAASSHIAIEEVFSHPMALAQCRRFFSQHPQIRAVEFHDTAAAVEHIMRAEEPQLAAIASAQAAEEFGAAILLKDIHDHPGNATRFALLVPARDAEGWLHRLGANENCAATGAVLLPTVAVTQLESIMESVARPLRSVVQLPSGEALWKEDLFLEFVLESEHIEREWAEAVERLTTHLTIPSIDLGAYRSLPV